MKYKVTGFNNFCRVFEVPIPLPKDYCFGGGIPTMFKMVDWFYPVIDLPQWAISEKKYNELVENGDIKPEGNDVTIESDELQSDLIKFISQKVYAIEGRAYIVLCNFEFAFVFTCVKEQK